MNISNIQSQSQEGRAEAPLTPRNLSKTRDIGGIPIPRNHFKTRDTGSSTPRNYPETHSEGLSNPRNPSKTDGGSATGGFSAADSESESLRRSINLLAVGRSQRWARWQKWRTFDL